MQTQKTHPLPRLGWRFAPAAVLVSAQRAFAQFGGQIQIPFEFRHPHLFHVWHLVLYGVIGGVFGAFFSQKFKKYRKLVWITVGVLLVAVGVYSSDPIAQVVGFLGGFITAWALLRVQALRKAWRDTTFGSAQWADLAHLQEHGLIGNSGLTLGYYQQDGEQVPVHYTSDRHLLTVAPTRSGKGVSAVIPNLLTYEGSALVIDPKGENAMISSARRGKGHSGLNIPGMGQEVHVVDPWGITGMPSACFNPLDWLDPANPDIAENALMLADSIVTPREAASTADPFWDNEARALAMGFILFVALDKEETDRSLARVRDIIVMDGEDFDGIMARMLASPNRIVSSTAARTVNKDPKLRAGVLASLQSHTHFLDSPRIRESLRRSDFKFEDLKTSKMTVYLVLPADRLQTFGRWLRLLVQQAITVNARNVAVKPEKPILFLLDEMAALGRLSAVEQAYSLMAGFGMQLWGIVQDLSQLERIYEKGWETFIGNSGVLQYFGSRDEKTASYFSKLCGVTTIMKFSFSNALSWAFSSGGGGGSSSSSSSKTFTYDVVQRHLAFADELMVMKPDTSLLLVENFNPIGGRKLRWYTDARLKHLGVNLHQPNVQGKARAASAIA